MKTKSISFFIFACIIFSCLTSCNSKGRSQSNETVENHSTTNKNGTNGTIVLQPLPDDAPLLFEDYQRRISGFWKEGIDAFFINVEAKKEGVKSFTVEDATAFESVVEHAMVLSNGTGMVRMLVVYDLNSGDILMPIQENFLGEIKPDKDGKGFTFYKYAEEMPIVAWDMETEQWIEQTHVPEELYNADFEKVAEELKSHLMQGLQLAALQKVHVNVFTKKITYLNEYHWSYIE